MTKLEWKKVNTSEFDRIPAAAGIYLISTLQDDDQYEVKYVGQASDLRNRAKEHFSKEEKNKELKDHIAKKYVMKFTFSEVSSQLERDGMELYLYQYFNPPYNEKAPPGKTVIKCSSLPRIKKYK